MKLKIKIKEVTEETRELTIEEQCMYTLTHIKYTGDTPSKEFMSAVQKHLNEIGLIDVIPKPHANWGLFRTVTIRDATPEEYRAWTYLQLVKHCTCPERKTNSLDCNDCFLSGACVASDFKTKIAIYILNGKEVILELVDE